MKISGIGMCVPERVVTNHELEPLLNTSDEWIQQRTGIVERRWVPEGVELSDLALTATQEALEAAKVKAEDIDMIIFATLSPEMCFPGTGVMLQAKLGIKNTPALDVRNQCSGFLYGLAVANGMICSGMYKRILLVGAEIQSRGILKIPQGRDTTVIFADGAGAVVLEQSEGPEGLIDIYLGADGRHAEELCAPGMGSRWEGFVTQQMLDEKSHHPYMNGRTVFKYAVTRMPKTIQLICERNEIAISDIDVLIPHQANLRINEMVAKTLGLEDKAFNNIEKYGNTTAATLPICIYEALQQEFLKPGHLLALTAFGSGFTWGSALIRM
ncbi:MAG: ketoacyl-ACP synthase III [Planctomycetes bacterium]|nr:ketoacyl-ACP synthase III [Planctomycetota bacterium]